MGKLDEVKSRIDWLKDLFKILIAIMVADIAGIAKLFMDDKIILFGYMFVTYFSSWLYCNKSKN